MDEGLIVRSRGLSWSLKVEAGCSVGWAPTRQHVTTRPGLGLRGVERARGAPIHLDSREVDRGSSQKESFMAVTRG